jgi:hypothetical protein
MGVKMNTAEDPYTITDQAKASKMKGAPSLKKWGIFDKFDGYYFEIANGGQRNDFRCVRTDPGRYSNQSPGVLRCYHGQVGLKMELHLLTETHNLTPAQTLVVAGAGSGDCTRRSWYIHCSGNL